MFALLVLLPFAVAVHYEPRGHYYYPIANAPNSSVTLFPTAPAPTITTTVTYTTCYTTKYPAICPDGICTSTYTITEYCPMTTCKPHTEIDYCPPGFTTTTTVCDHCAPKPTTVTLTHPNPPPIPTPSHPSTCHGDKCLPECEGDECPPPECEGKECPPSPPKPCYGDECCGDDGYCPPKLSKTDDGCGGHGCPPPTETDDGCGGYGCPTPTETDNGCSGDGCPSDVPKFTGGAAVAGAGAHGVAALVVAAFAMLV
jgi:hypothetical protein